MYHGISKLLLGSVFAALLFGSATSLAQFEDMHDAEAQYVEPFQVFDNLYYVGGKWVAAWLLETNEGLILFDAMYEEHVDQLIDNIRSLGFDPDDIRYVIVSHAHYDHVGGAYRFQRDFNSVVMMTEADWQMTTEPAVFREYERPMRHLAPTDGSTLRLGRDQLTFYITPGHTTGVLSTRFLVYDDGYPHEAFLFGGVGLNFEGEERLQSYVDSVKRLQAMPGIEVNITNHEFEGRIFERYELLKQRKPGEPHPFVDSAGFYSWLEGLQADAEELLAKARAN
jgi:metallo-beta-lactamase class B